MTANGWFQILLFFAIVALITRPLGKFMTRVFNRERTFLDPVLRPIERLIYKLTWVDENHEMGWKEYCVSMLLFSAVSMLVLYGFERLQGFLPLNPQKLGAVNPAPLAFNTAASFTTNTNWQNYGGETTMSYLTQMAGLAYHNFMSAAVGVVLAIAFIRGIARRQMQTIGLIWFAAVCGYCFRFASWGPCCSCPKASCRTSSPMTRQSSWNRCRFQKLARMANLSSMPRARQ
jgi:K+-transporting ATPase ATPase A chain